MQRALGSLVIASLALAAGLLLAGPDARANGRFPNAQFFVAHGRGPARRLALRATFGLLVSDDDGASFRWYCEEGLGYAGEWDPPLAFTSDGALHVGLEAGLATTRDGCAVRAAQGLGNRTVLDLTVAGEGAVLYAGEQTPGVPARVHASEDLGARFTERSTLDADLRLTTLDAAPSLPLRLYVTALTEPAREPVLLRSNDGGRRFERLTPALHGAREVYLGAVRATNPDEVWLRGTTADGGGVVLRSLDGGASFAPVHRTRGAVLGFALASDGRAWLGGPDDGLWAAAAASAGVDPVFRRVGATRVQCLRHHDDALYVCAEWQRDGVGLLRWRDGAPEPATLLLFTELAGAPRCDDELAPGALCAMRWPSQRAMLARPTRDAGANDAGVSPPLDAGVTPALDASARDDAPPAPRPSCACAVRRAPPRAERASSATLAGLAGAVFLAVRARRRASLLAKAR